MSHKTLSPSSAHRRIACPGSLAACKAIPNKANDYAAEGTAYHQVSATALEHGTDCAEYVGRVANVYTDGSCLLATVKDDRAEFSYVIDEENAASAQVYVDAMRRRLNPECIQHYEVKLDTSRVVGVKGQGGTGDCVTLDYGTKTIYVDDLKFGRGVQVFAKEDDGTPNAQLGEYGGAALENYGLLCDWEWVVIGIHQPRIGHVDELRISVDLLRDWLWRVVRPAEMKAYELWERGTPEQIAANLHSSAHGCKFCPIAGRCKARLDAAMSAFPVLGNAATGLSDGRKLLWESTEAEVARFLALSEDFDTFVGDIRAEALRRLKNGDDVPGWKMVNGKKGRRSLDPTVDINGATAEEHLKGTLGDDAYEPAELKSAAELDKLLNKKKHPQYGERAALWNDLQAAISQSEGQPTLARVNDPRDSITMPASEFPIIPT